MWKDLFMFILCMHGSEELLSVLDISYQWYTMLGVLIVWLVGLGVSLVTRQKDGSPLKQHLTYGRKKNTKRVSGIANQAMHLEEISTKDLPTE